MKRPAPAPRTAPRSPAPPSLGSDVPGPVIPLPIPPISPRHREVLWENFRLISERGYAGASLRELARRLGVSQPSLYHYAATKEQLVEQTILHVGAELLGGFAPPASPPLAELPRQVVERIFELYRDPRYAPFLRFLFAVSTERPAFRDAVRGLYGVGFRLGSEIILRPYVEAGSLDAEEGRHLLRMLINSVGLLLMEEMVLYGEPEPSAEARELGELVIQLVGERIARGAPTPRRPVWGRRPAARR